MISISNFNSNLILIELFAGFGLGVGIVVAVVGISVVGSVLHLLGQQQGELKSSV